MDGFVCVGKKHFQSKKRNNQEYQQFFEMALSNSELVPMKTSTITVNQLLLVAIEPELYIVRARTKSLFPFPHCIHKWCQQQFSSSKELPSVEIVHRVMILEQVSIGNVKDSLKQWESICSEKANGIYAMDLIRKHFSQSLCKCKQRHDRYVLFVLQGKEKELGKKMNDYNGGDANNAGQLLVDVTQQLTDQLLQSAQQLELRHLGIQYLKMINFIDKKEHFTDFKQSLLENEQCARDIISQLFEQSQ
ncbi:hypothetical protein RFI_18553 [Reticulomyxa filosa]|uniref:Uncharacterized protein n=1 Tax=Reticulomyxa filosa TaxID=46433 RepID=X6MXY1_RETFI|nr:hypothetical protein RFI_18553 [Reticulomyxa filosa]|eukprot:ETO18701.1 hypothetical protein RFI_18553 [Reticulomyxa filosa]